MRKIFTLLLFLLSVRSASAQVSTQGKDFWVGLMYNINMATGTSNVYISAKEPCSGTITNPTTGYSSAFTITAPNSAVSVTIPAASIANNNINEIISNFAVHIVADDTISVFGLSKAPASSDASFFIPTPALGSTYRTMNYTPLSSYYPSESMIIGVHDNTQVEIIPSVNTTGSMQSGQTYTITLDAGETYMFSAAQDMTGTVIRTVDPCGQIAVLSGAACANVPLTCPACDHIFEEILPVETWGKSFFCTPLRNKQNDIFRVLASENTTTVNLGSTIKSLQAGQYFDTTVYGKPIAITADKPVAVMGYVTGSACNNSVGDPDMYWVPPVEQNLFDLVFNTVVLSGIDSEYVNIVVKTPDTSYVRLNGLNISKTFKVDPAFPQYAYSQYWLTSNVNHLVSEKGFIATVYGSGNTSFDSYAYSAGTSLQKLNITQFLINTVTRNVKDTLELCKNKLYKFGSFKTGVMAWDFGDGDTIQSEFPLYTFTDPGYHYIYSYPTAASTCFTLLKDTLELTVYVNEQCLVVNPVPDTLICRGEWVPLYAKGTTPELESCRKYEWYIGSFMAGRGTPIVRPVATTTYKLIATDTCVGSQDTSYITIIVRDSVKALINPDTTICKGNSVRLTLSASGGDSTYTYTWISGLAGTGFTDTLVTPDITTTYAVIVDDECTIDPDTAYITVYVRPDLTIQPPTDTTICTQGTVILRPAGNGGDSSYTFQWKLNGAFADTLAFTSDTTATLEIWLTDGCTVTPDTGWVTVFVRPAPQLGISPDTVICAGGQANMRAWGTYGDSSYIITWEGLGTGTTAQTNPAGTTLYKITLDDQCSATGDTGWVMVYVRPGLDARICADTMICIGQSVDLWVKGNGGDSSYTYAWEGMGNISLQHVVPTTTTTYRLILGDNCTVKNDTAYTTVYVRPPLGLTANNDTVICLGQSVMLTATGSGGDSTYTYTWNQGLGNGAAHMVTPNATTTYTATLDDNCSPDVQEQVIVTIEGNPAINFTAAPTDVCLGDSIWFTNNTVGNYAYLWRFGDQVTSTGNNPVHLYGKDGQYPVTLVAISPLQCRDSVIINNMVRVYPIPVAAYTATPPVTNLLKPLIQFNNTSKLATDYEWDFGDFFTSTDKNPQHSYADTGWYDISLVAIGANSCADTTYGRMRINDFFRVFMPNSFTPNHDNINDVFEVKGRGIIKYHISIFNRWGEMIFESDDIKKSWNGQMESQSRSSPDGIYYYVISLTDVTLQQHHYEGQIVLLQ